MRALSTLAGYLPFACACAAIWLVSGMERPDVPSQLIFEHADKVLHALAYSVLGVLAAFGARAQPKLVMLGAGFFLATAYGVVDEIHQSDVAGRSSSAWDVVADGVGALLGAWRASVWWNDWWLPRRQRRRAHAEATGSGQAS